MKRLAIIVAPLVLAGCSTATYAPAAQTGTTAVFIRQHAEPTAWNVAVVMDGTKAASIANGSYASFSVTPGTHKIEIDWPFLAGQEDLGGDVQFADGETSYFLITARYEVTDGGYVGGGNIALFYNKKVGLVRLQREAAKKYLEKM